MSESATPANEKSVKFKLADKRFTYLVVNPENIIPRIGAFMGANHDDTIDAQQALEDKYRALGYRIITGEL